MHLKVLDMVDHAIFLMHNVTILSIPELRE